MFGEKVFGIEPSAKWTAGVDGVAEGKVLYNNLETLIDSFGTRFDPIMYGQGDLILVVEELDVNKSTLQRQIDIIFNHKRANRIKGFVMGRMINVNEMSYPKWGRKLSPKTWFWAESKTTKFPWPFVTTLVMVRGTIHPLPISKIFLQSQISFFGQWYKGPVNSFPKRV